MLENELNALSDGLPILEGSKEVAAMGNNLESFNLSDQADATGSEELYTSREPRNVQWSKSSLPSNSIFKLYAIA